MFFFLQMINDDVKRIKSFVRPLTASETSVISQIDEAWGNNWSRNQLLKVLIMLKFSAVKHDILALAYYCVKHVTFILTVRNNEILTLKSRSQCKGSFLTHIELLEVLSYQEQDEYGPCIWSSRDMFSDCTMVFMISCDCDLVFFYCRQRMTVKSSYGN